MITAFVILMIFSGRSGGESLNLSDPAVLARFQQNVSVIIPDPERQRAVANSVVQLNQLSWQARNPNGLIEDEVKNVRTIAADFRSTPAELAAAVKALEVEISRENTNMIRSREIIRQNTSSDEWKKLLKSLQGD